MSLARKYFTRYASTTSQVRLVGRLTFIRNVSSKTPNSVLLGLKETQDKWMKSQDSATGNGERERETRGQNPSFSASHLSLVS